MYYLVAYDVKHVGRGAKIARMLADYGFRIQKSVFEINVANSDWQRFYQKLRKMLDEREDRIRLYPLCETCRKNRWHKGRDAQYQDSPEWLVI